MKYRTLNHIARLVVAAVLAMSSAQGAWAFDPSTRASHSKLASGTWVKVRVTESGVHAITAADARAWGFSDLSKVHIFGAGGAPISEKLTADIADDLPQLPVVRSADRILFYAQGPTTWTVTSGRWQQVQHPYATAGYYLVTDSEQYADIEPGTATAPTGTAVPATTFTDRLYHEEELVNPGETGRELLGEDFRYNTSQTFNFGLTNRVAGEPVTVVTNFMSKVVNGRSGVTFRANGTNVASLPGDTISRISDIQHFHYQIGNFVKTVELDDDNLAWNVNYSYSGSIYLARLNYITVNYKRQLALTNGHLYFGQLPSTTNVHQYQLSGVGSDVHVWDVTTPWSPVDVAPAVEGGTATFAMAGNSTREFAAFSESGTYPSPTLDSRVANQDIHGEATPDMIIVSPTQYLAQAQRIATMHEQVDSMRVLIVEQDKVFNEFSSGTPDMMALRMMNKMFWDRGADSTGHKLGYMLLLGNGTYDNRLLTTTAQNLGYPLLLTWQTPLARDEYQSYTSDDPVAILDDNSGSDFYRYPLSIAVGRMPVRSVSECRTVVDKLIAYVTTADPGSWRNNLMDLADDGNRAAHMQQNESALRLGLSNGGSDFVYNKVYIDAFEAQYSGTGRSYPDARAKQFRLLDEGTVWWNFTGHGSPRGLTAESQLTYTDVNERLYYSHLPILAAYACEFFRHDASTVSAGELMYTNPRGGIIAALMPPRTVYVAQNGLLHNDIAHYQFGRDEQGLPLRIGDIMRLGKNRYVSVRGGDDNTAHYMVFGDPAMRPAFPSAKVELLTINGHDVTTDADMPVFQARQTLQLTGRIVDAVSGEPLTGFNGQVIATLYDCEESVVSHGYGDDGTEYVFQDRANRLAVKTDSVSAGTFNFALTIPSEIIATADNFTPSMINLYAYSMPAAPDDTKWNGGMVDAQGTNTNFYIYGYDDSVVSDTIGPNITYLALNTTAFADGDDVNESPLVLAHMTDESGINMSSSGIGHAMTLTLDGTTTYSDVSTYFTSGVTDGLPSGTIRYQLSGLEGGTHTLRLRVWDVFNNSSERTIGFNVATGMKPEIYSLYTDANPASVSANFYVTHNRPDATLTIKLDVFDLLGRLVWTTTQSGRTGTTTSFPISWDLTDTNGSRVPRGIYVYRATISADGVLEVSKARKIAVTAR